MKVNGIILDNNLFNPDRDKKLKTIEAAKIQKFVSRELQNVNCEVKECRGILNEVRCGDKRRMRNILQDHRDLQLAYENHYPDVGTIILYEKKQQQKTTNNNILFYYYEIFPYRLFTMQYFKIVI